MKQLQRHLGLAGCHNLRELGGINNYLENIAIHLETRDRLKNILVN